MRLWPQRSPAERIVYVPVALPDARPHDARWSDAEYLRSLTGFAANGLYMAEVSDALAECRLAADKAKTPDELAGVQVGIRLLRGLLTMSARARALLQATTRHAEGTGDDHPSLG